MPIEIQRLPKEQWQDYVLPIRYESAHYYDAEISTGPEGFSAKFTKRAFDAPVRRGCDGDFPDRLYAQWWEGAEAYGIFDGEALVGCIELWKENWSNRLRVTELWVADSHHRRGFGGALMDFAKAQAKALGCRALMLETQSGNETAIAFYLAQGLTLFGFDRSCYTNNDVERGDVRLELGCYV